MKILVINSGSSSIKYQLFDMSHRTVMAKGLAERIGISGSLIDHRPAGKSPYLSQQEICSHGDALELVLAALMNQDHGVVGSISEIDAIGHRVVHGGTLFSEPVLIDREVKQKIEQLSGLAPLHNPANLSGIDACEKAIPGVRQVAVFDTAFHQTIAEYVYLYAIPYRYYEKYGIRKYGFHGTSHKYVAGRAAAFMGRGLQELRLITCHLGNGASITAVEGGKSKDTSMGFTPLEGVAMGTRSGDLDPAAVTYLMDREGLSTREINQILNHQSGVLGLSGLSSDFRDLEAEAEKGNRQARLALDVFAHKARKYIGAYTAVLNGLDALVFTGGVGENSSFMRDSICNGLDYLGISIDASKNCLRGVEADISAPGSQAKILVIPTNEELMIAEETLQVISGS